MNNAAKLRSVGIDVTNPDPYVEGSIEASSLWSKDYNDWLQLGQQLKQSKKKIEEYNTQLRNPNAIVNPLPEGELIEDVNKYTMEVDRKPMDALQKVFSNTYNKYIYDRKNLDQRAKEAAQAEKALTEEYDMLIAQNPNFKNKLEGEKQLYLASMLEPIYDTAFAEKLQTEREKLQQRKKEFDWEQYKWGKEFGYKTNIKEFGVADAMSKMMQGNKVAYELFKNVPISDTENIGGELYNRMLGGYKRTEKRPNGIYLIFSTIRPDGSSGPDKEVQFTDAEGNFVRSKTYQDIVENAATKGISYTDVGGEVKAGTKKISGSGSISIEKETKPTPRNKMTD